MEVFKTKKEAVHFSASLLKKGKSIGFVPTMGALHQGHLELVKKAKSENDVAITSIFVNPTQFNNPEDLKKYPRMPEVDMQLLQSVHCDALFMPEVEEMYATGDVPLAMHLGLLESVMEGAFRPGHFKGVITVVDKLFNIVQPTEAYFGEKDFQQLAVIRFMAKKLHPQLSVTGCPTIREADGLAMSSRNLRLTPLERQNAPIIFNSMMDARAWKAKMNVKEIIEAVIQRIDAVQGFKTEYFEIVNTSTLQSIVEWNEKENLRACIAVNTSTVRLIDNIAF
jgi:pantoate--beta-alanine ligase